VKGLKMQKFRVVAEISYLLETDIEADSLEQAENIAHELDGATFNEIEQSGDFKIINVERA
jgi:hypothetical protein